MKSLVNRIRRVYGFYRRANYPLNHPNAHAATLKEIGNHPLVSRVLDQALCKHKFNILSKDAYAKGGNGIIFTVFGPDGSRAVLKIPNYPKYGESEHYRLEEILKEEARVLHDFNCPELPRLIACDSDGRYLLREFVDGKTLERLHKGRRVSDELIMMLLANLLEMTSSLFATFHSAENGCYVIRDFKPTNIIVNDANAKFSLIDVGGSRRAGHRAVSLRFQRLGSGMWKHWPPEQLFNIGEPVDRRWDYFSFGVTAHFVLTGHFPYTNHEADSCKAWVAYADEYVRATGRIWACGGRLGLPPQWCEFLCRCLHPVRSVRPYTLME